MRRNLEIDAEGLEIVMKEWGGRGGSLSATTAVREDWMTAARTPSAERPPYCDARTC